MVGFLSGDRAVVVALARLALAARDRHREWTRETYIAVDDAIAAVFEGDNDE